MIPIDKVQASNARGYQGLDLVAVFVGGTQGIGRYAVEALADLYSNQPGTSLRIYILARRKEAADQVLESCRRRCPHGEYNFVQAENLALIEDVDKTSAEILKIERTKENPRIDLLVQTQAQILFGARRDTKEGLDQLMSLAYYSRIRFITRLMPLLEASSNGARVLSIDAAGSEQSLFREDLSLRDPKHYGYRNVKSHAAYMTTMTFERLAADHDRVAFIYMYPGMVLGPSYRDASLPWWFKTVLFVVEPLLSVVVATSSNHSGSRTLFVGRDSLYSPAGSGKESFAVKGTNGSRGTGCYAIGSQCSVIAEKKHADLYPSLRMDGFRKDVWEHTVKAFSDVEAGRRFED